MECDFCKNRFMLHANTFEDENYLHFFCSVCGLPNAVDTFYCPEVLEKMQQTTINYFYSELEKALDKSINEINKNGLVKITMNIPKYESEKNYFHLLMSMKPLK